MKTIIEEQLKSLVKYKGFLLSVYYKTINNNKFRIICFYEFSNMKKYL